MLLVATIHLTEFLLENLLSIAMEDVEKFRSFRLLAIQTDEGVDESRKGSKKPLHLLADVAGIDWCDEL